jgi:dihydroorotase
MEFTLTGAGDAHVHVRQNTRMKNGKEEETALLDFSVPHTTSWASFMLPMPNTIPSIRTGAEAFHYCSEILDVSNGTYIIKCIKAVEGFTTPEVIKTAKAHGVDAIKIYFEGVTTNANHGDAVTWDGFYQMLDIWRECEAQDIVICIHPEKPKVFSLRREVAAHKAIKWLHKMCPNVRISVEHITDRRTVRLVERLGENVRGTITAHHLWDDLDMVIGGNLDPHSFCKPPAKFPADLHALREAVMSRNRKFMFGSDSAPHPQHDKECDGCAGCFTGPYCLQMVAHLLFPLCSSEHELRRIMQGFMGDFASDFYRIPNMGRMVTLVKKQFVIPTMLHTNTGVPVVPFMAGKTLDWSIEATS